MDIPTSSSAPSSLSPSTIKSRLLYSFTNLTHSLRGDEQSAEKWSTALIAAYTEPQRHYHTITHIYSMLQCLSQIPATQIQNRVAVELAIFFHDWVYDPCARDNELQSIAVLRDFARELELPDALVAKVVHYIEATIEHRLGLTDAGDGDLKLFLDFDLEVLGREKEGYGRYKEEIRREYGHLSGKEYCEGRRGVLKRFLERERLYFSEWGFNKFEVRARENLRGEIGDLEGS